MGSTFKGEILALDLATRVGWCAGTVDGPLSYGSFRCAPEGSQSAAIFGGAMKWLAERVLAFKPRIIVYEAPIDPRMLKKINKDTIRRLNGMPAVIEAVAHNLGVYDVREIETGDLKHYWHNRRNLKREQVKRLTMEKMRSLGYDPQDEDAADAIAVHRYMAAVLVPELRLEASPLFKPGTMRVTA